MFWESRRPIALPFLPFGGFLSAHEFTIVSLLGGFWPDIDVTRRTTARHVIEAERENMRRAMRLHEAAPLVTAEGDSPLLADTSRVERVVPVAVVGAKSNFPIVLVTHRIRRGKRRRG